MEVVLKMTQILTHCISLVIIEEVLIISIKNIETGLLTGAEQDKKTTWSLLPMASSYKNTEGNGLMNYHQWTETGRILPSLRTRQLQEVIDRTQKRENQNPQGQGLPGRIASPQQPLPTNNHLTTTTTTISYLLFSPPWNRWVIRLQVSRAEDILRSRRRQHPLRVY